MSKTYETLILDAADGVATITLNRPDALNAFNDAMLSELNDVLKNVARDDAVRCVVITGAGRAFCSGQDLKALEKYYENDGRPPFGDHLRENYNPIATRILTMDKPVIAAVNGVAAGAGCSLALACDLRIAAESAKFVEAFINVGLIPDCSGSFTLPRLIGAARAAEFCFFGGNLSAAEAANIGMINRVVPDADLAGAAGEWAAKLARMPTRGIALTKRLLVRSWSSSLDDQLEQEAFAQETAGKSADHAEGVRAFVEKRKPAFKGR